MTDVVRDRVNVDEGGLITETMTINMGPSHPAMHGTVRLILELDGETIVRCKPEVGYLHRGFEKMCENGTWNQAVPYTDRLNYASPLLNNVGYALAVEKLLGIEVPERAQYIRTIAGEVSRMADHFTSIGAGALELGGFTGMLWAIEAREYLYKLTETIAGARLTTNYTRVGGLRHDLPESFAADWAEAKPKIQKLVDDIHRILTENRVFVDRMAGIGKLGPQEAIDYGWTGVCLRSTGVDYDVRKAHPYLVYDRLDWDVPLGHEGDNYDRYLCRMEELGQSIRIIDQCLEQLPDGPVRVEDWAVSLPDKDDVYNSIEGMIAHFKLIMEGGRVPVGEAYGYTEGGNGELGFYIVSAGGGHPWRLHVRGPCFALMQALEKLVVGGMIADIIPTFDTINMIGGEIDR